MPLCPNAGIASLCAPLSGKRSPYYPIPPERTASRADRTNSREQFAVTDAEIHERAKFLARIRIRAIEAILHGIAGSTSGGASSILILEDGAWGFVVDDILPFDELGPLMEARRVDEKWVVTDKSVIIGVLTAGASAFAALGCRIEPADEASPIEQRESGIPSAGKSTDGAADTGDGRILPFPRR